MKQDGPKDFWGFEGKGYVTEDGNYGGDIVLVFEHDALTQEQWDRLGECSDYDRIKYVQAILNGDDLSEWEYETE
jgi:hypothetical protein